MDLEGTAVSGIVDRWRGSEAVIVLDWLGRVGGAELVAKELADLFPQAPILALFAAPGAAQALGIDPHRVRQSYLGRIPNAFRYRKFLVPLFADAIQTLDVGGAALIVSASHAVAKCIPHRSFQRHVSYVYTPARYAHDLMPEYLSHVPAPARPWVRGALRDLATWDIATAGGVTRYIGISRAVRERIWRTYRRRASIIHPPVHLDDIPLGPERRDDYYVTLSRLVPQKKVELAVQAAVSLGRRLIVIGDGPERAALERLARAGSSGTIEFVGRVTEETKFALLGGAKAFLCPAEDDFGIVGVEALATGTPVVAYGRAGLLDVLGADRGPVAGTAPQQVPGGILFSRQTPGDLVDAIRALEATECASRGALRLIADRFDVRHFRRRLLDIARRVCPDDSPAEFRGENRE